MAAKKETAAAAVNPDKKKAIETAMQQIEKMYGKGSIMRYGDGNVANVEAIPTGSLALDLMEELRPCFAERFVLTMINDRILSAQDLEVQENGAVLLTDEGRRSFLRQWQTRKSVQIMHPFLKEKLPWGLVPYVQALLLARYLRGDLDAYPPFLWK